MENSYIMNQILEVVKDIDSRMVSIEGKIERYANRVYKSKYIFNYPRSDIYNPEKRMESLQIDILKLHADMQKLRENIHEMNKKAATADTKVKNKKSGIEEEAASEMDKANDIILDISKKLEKAMRITNIMEIQEMVINYHTEDIRQLKERVTKLEKIA